MKPIKYGKLVLLFIAVVIQISFAKTYHVAKDGSGNFTTIQTAVDTADAEDEIIIDDIGVYEEQVIIDSTKNGLVLRSSSITSASKPTIKYRDIKNVKPESEEESHSDATITFDRNGALIILAAKRVRIEGIAIDGGKPFVFGKNGIWFNSVDMKTYPLQHGNGGISLWHAGDAIVRYCDISNAFFGINVKDRNIGGVFANPNPSDIDSLEIVPFAGFAKYGNHLIEHNRIHDNSFGFYSESAWDLGTTIRYNLFYENHHASSVFAGEVDDATSDGSNYPGGAIMTKDNNLTPLAIYNNTFWHNLLIFVGIWKSGGQHLIFNNIIGPPYEYWESNDDGGVSSNLEMEKCYVNREYNSVYAAQQRAPTANNISVINEFSQPDEEGDLITPKPFPASADVRYLETEFLSVSPTSPQFLEPDWANENVATYIQDKGWEPSGIKDPDGSRADLGAIPYSQVQVNDLILIRPTIPVIVDDKAGTAKINFSIIPRIGEITNPKIKLFRVVTSLDSSSKNWANLYTPIKASNIITLTPPTTELKVGSNTIQIPVPSGGLGTFAFFEMTIEGLDSDGQPYTTAVGFIPYRKLDYYLEVTVQDAAKTKTLTEVRAGDPVNIKVVAFKANGTKFTDSISPLVLNLGSTFELRTPGDLKLDTIRGAMPKGEGDIAAIFTKVPVGGIDQVIAAGTYKELAFLGASADIKILPGDPDTVIWQDPPSKMTKTAYSNVNTAATAKVYDRFGNLITTPNKVNCVSLKPLIGDLVLGEDETDITGLAIFLTIVKNGTKGDTFPLVASLKQTGKTDTCYMVVGDARDRFVIFYGDTAAYDSSAALRGCAGDRLPVVIRAIKTGSTVSTDKNGDFVIDPSSGVTFYDSDTATTQIFGSTLVNGQAKIWVQGTGRNVANGRIRVFTQAGDIDDGERDSVVFLVCENLVDSARYYADNGFGSVNRLEVYYMKPLTTEEIPDSFRLSWPERGSSNTVMVRKDAVVQDPDNLAHLTITINPPFAAGQTRKASAASSELGVAYWFNPKTPDAPLDPDEFDINDGVGPLIESAILVERFSDGNDTLFVTFTEPVTAEVVRGTTLYLIKEGTATQTPIEVINSIPDGNDGTRAKIVISSSIEPRVGDSLKIIHTGTIVDVFNNHAHIDNRPAKITLQEVPAEISSAWYYDRNADGQIDVVRIVFKKKINPDSTVIKLKWEGNVQTGDVFTGSMITIVTTGITETDTVEVTLADDTFSYGTLKNKTSGSMVVTATFRQFKFKDDSDRSSMVNDMAAPVLLDSVNYNFGKIVNSMKDGDTLFLRFTELLQGAPKPPDSLPINAIHGTAPYSIKYVRFEGEDQSHVYRYIVDSTTVVSNSGLPALGDSAWISVLHGAINVVDAFGNAQLNPDNKKVRIAIKMPPIRIVFEAGPLPYVPATGQGLSIVLRNDEKADKSTAFDVNFTIYDKVGNVVKRFPDEKGTLLPTTKGFVLVTWDGTNIKGRHVGTGTYLCCVNGNYTPLNSTSRKLDVEPIKLGILPNP